MQMLQDVEIRMCHVKTGTSGHYTTRGTFQKEKESREEGDMIKRGLCFSGSTDHPEIVAPVSGTLPTV